MGNIEKVAYRYILREGKEEVESGWTYDTARRQAECRTTHPTATFKQVGGAVTLDVARKWEQKKHKPKEPIAVSSTSKSDKSE